jgi:hypothetical protein
MAASEECIRESNRGCVTAMNFEFLIGYRWTEGVDVEQVLVELLTKVLQDNLNDIESDAAKQRLRLHHERTGTLSYDDNGVLSAPALLCFSLDLDDEIEQIETVVEDFAALLPDTAPIFHAVKFEDPFLHAVLVRRAEEIFALEMKLRRVLTLIYLHANEVTDPYDLLSDEMVQPISKDKPQEPQMKAATENQFFHLTFGQYVGLNHRTEVKQISALLEVVRDSYTYEVFRTEINRLPIEHEDDAALLAGLKERMDAIESMRNCVAHNRRPSKKIVENYENARPLLVQLLDNYLARWERPAPIAAAAPASPANPSAENQGNTMGASLVAHNVATPIVTDDAGQQTAADPEIAPPAVEG